MKPLSRRTFLQSTAGLLLLNAAPFAARKNTPRLSFSTLGCPDWTFEKVVQFAAQHGYSGLEMRGIQRELFLPKCKAFSTPQAIAATRTLVASHNLAFVNLGSSAAMHHSAGAERQKNLDEAKRFI